MQVSPSNASTSRNRSGLTDKTVHVIKPQVTDELADYMDGSGSGAGELYDSEVYEVNNYGPNDNLLVRRDRDRDVPESELKTILMWNDAYGVRTYDIGHGREPFYKYVKQPPSK